jgi:flagellar assembly protein FliH
MTERRERIPADEVKDSKRWNLPYWTEPSHLVHSEEQAEDDSEVVVEDEEIEVEPLTAEQLELIRQEAFNEGLDQGLVEGRQKGEKLGYEAGHLEGLEKGQIEGRKLGFDSGFEKGEAQALEQGEKNNQKNTNNLKSILNAIDQHLNQQKKEVSENLPDIILAIAKAVVTQELSQGSEHIVAIVQQALDSLPLESGHLKIEVNPQDLPYIEAAIEQGEFEGEAHASEKIDEGGCRIHTRYSAVNFTISERWQAIEKQYRRQVQLALNDNEDDNDDNFNVSDMYDTLESQSVVDESVVDQDENSKTESTSNEVDEHIEDKTEHQGEAEKASLEAIDSSEDTQGDIDNKPADEDSPQQALANDEALDESDNDDVTPPETQQSETTDHTANQSEQDDQVNKGDSSSHEDDDHEP